MNERDKEFANQVQWTTDVSYEELQKFADLIRSGERESCAEMCDNEAKQHERNTYDAYDGRYDWKAEGAKECADAIRTRGNLNG